jgi:RimJ/RimL family protein N-acetyltransferase
MLQGENVRLRVIRSADLDLLQERLSDLSTRGDYFPIGLPSEPSLRSAFDKSGFWSENEGMLLITGRDGDVVGEIEFYPIADYLQGYELSYQLFGAQHTGRGYTSEAVTLLVRYLFDCRRVNRMQLTIHPDNTASRRVAQKCGFTLEGVMRGCWFRRGTYHDLELWSLLRDEAADQS